MPFIWGCMTNGGDGHTSVSDPWLAGDRGLLPVLVVGCCCCCCCCSCCCCCPGGAPVVAPAAERGSPAGGPELVGLAPDVEGAPDAALDAGGALMVSAPNMIPIKSRSSASSSATGRRSCGGVLRMTLLVASVAAALKAAMVAAGLLG